MKTFIFECSTATYLDCVQKNLFGSNLSWPLQLKTGDYCCLYHYEVETLFGLWQASSEGGKNLVPKAWGGRFPFQAQVSLTTPDIIELPKAKIIEYVFNQATGKFDNVLEGDRAESLLQMFRNQRVT